MSAWIRLLAPLCWLGIGLLVGRRFRRTGTGILWTVLAGPMGLVLFAYGETRRARIPAPEAPWVPADLDIAVEVERDGAWHPGRLRSWSTESEQWHGWVHHELDGVAGADWFDSDHVRRPTEPGAAAPAP